MKKEQKELLFRLALKELGLEVVETSRYLEILQIDKFIFRMEWLIGSFDKESGEYYLYGMPSTNDKVMNLIENTLELKVTKINLYQDKTRKYDKCPYHL